MVTDGLMSATFSSASVRAVLLSLGVTLLGLTPGWAQHAHHNHGGGKPEKAKLCKEATLACASTVTPTFAQDGTLWLAFAAAGRIMVTKSTDLGRSFADAVPVNADVQQLDWGPDSRPKIVVEPSGRITVAFAIFKDKAFNGQVFVSQSEDGGKSFSAPKAVTNDPESQRFEALGLDTEGRVFAAWLDKRNRPAARARGEKYAGAALAYAWLSGVPASGEVKLAKDNTCECCRVAVAFAGAGQPVVLFRNIFEGSVRDHAVITFADPATPGPVKRVSDDGWKTEACPHHGPSLAVSPQGTYHVAWFTNGAKRDGLFYAHSRDRGETFSAPVPLGAASRQPSRPALLATAEAAHAVWMEYDGKAMALMGMRSGDDGRTWSAPQEIARNEAESDHPQLLTQGGRVFVAWKSRGAEGFRLIALEATR